MIIRSVSYTHLDVYKRQGKIGSITLNRIFKKENLFKTPYSTQDMMLVTISTIPSRKKITLLEPRP